MLRFIGFITLIFMILVALACFNGELKINPLNSDAYVSKEVLICKDTSIKRIQLMLDTVNLSCIGPFCLITKVY